MLDDIARKFELDKEVLQQEYFIWCQVMKRQLSQIHKADFLEFGYFKNQVGKLDFHFYSDKYTDVNGFYPSIKYVKRSDSIKKKKKIPVIPSSTQSNQKRLNIWTILLPILIFSALLLSSSIVNKDRISYFFNNDKIETTTRINHTKEIKSKKTNDESTCKKKKTTRAKAPISSKINKPNKETYSKKSTRSKESDCMIVTGSFQKVKNLENMERSLREKFPNQVVKNVHGKYTRIGLRISCEDDTSIHTIKKIITSDAWLLKK